MIITQNKIDDKWLIIIDFESVRYTNGNGPFYLSGNFNGWDKRTPEYRIKGSPSGGMNDLLNFVLEVPIYWKEVQFKIFNARLWDPVLPGKWVSPGYSSEDRGYWLEPNKDKKYYGNNVIKKANDLGTYNIFVKNEMIDESVKS